ASIGLLLGVRDAERDEAPENDKAEATPPTEIVQNGADVLVPLIAIFAAYIVMHGHLGPGGGFQGGAVMASCVFLLVLTKPGYRSELARLSAIESLAGLLIVLVGIAGIVLAGGFLDNRILPLGEFGAFFSAGAIPILSVLLGAKVGCELSVIIDRFRACSAGIAERGDDLPHRSRHGPDAYPDRRVGHADPPRHPAHHHRLLSDGNRQSYRYYRRRIRHQRDRSHYRCWSQSCRRVLEIGRSNPLGVGGHGHRYWFRRHRRNAGLRHPPVRGQEDALNRHLHGFEMVGSLAHPLNIFILGLSGGFLIPLVNLLGKRWVSAAFFLALAAMAAIS